MKKYISILGLLFLMGCSVIVWTNYINPCPPLDVIFVDTCIVDTFGVSGVDTTKCQTDK